MTVKLRISLTGLCLLMLLSATAQQKKTKKSQAKPNIIFILADDLGIGDVSCYGSDSNSTPTIDAFARSGMRFNHAYTAPLCGPSRAMVLTGRYAFRTGAVNQDKVALIKPADEVLIPTVLKSSGYVSSLVGKWSQFSQTPADFGFDDYITFKGSGVYWSAGKKKAQLYTENGDEKELRPDRYMPDLMHEHLVKFITDNRSKPFFLYYSMSHVHAKIQRTPDSKPDSKDLYADNTAYMDKLVGKLLELLADLKLRDNTLIVFMGDNGTANQYAQRSTIGGRKLSGKKGSMLECGSLVPFIASWPGQIAAGTVSNSLVDASDLMPTFAEVAGATLPAGKVIDGMSQAAVFFNKKGSTREWIFTELGNKWYVRDARWKLNREGELFDMADAPFSEPIVPADSKDAAAIAARQKLAKVLETLNPAGGIHDDGNGSGRHGNKKKKDEEE